MNKIILIGNYLPDKQESMIRFAYMMALGFKNEGIIVDIWWPQVCFGLKAKNTATGIGKWLGYLDKYVVFPLVLKLKVLKLERNGSDIHYHICDHSNAPYLNTLPVERTSITCHDVIAIRGGLGYTEFCHPASKLGKVLQKWILQNLSSANLLATVSNCTLLQLKEIAPVHPDKNKNWRVIYNAFNGEFKPNNNHRAQSLSKYGLGEKEPFILHVGSELPRKNRKLLLDMVHSLGTRWQGFICYAGKPLDEELIAHAKQLGLMERTISIVAPDHDTLVVLYSRCQAFIFPSFSEGFGWPLIEAQACGAPVITSNFDPMHEVTGGVALYANPANPEEFLNAFLLLQDNAFRSECIKLGFKNAQRFNLSKMIKEYMELHQSNKKKIEPIWF